MATIAEIGRQRTDLGEVLASVMEDRISVGHYMGDFCRFAGKFFPNEGRYTVHKSTERSKEMVSIFFGHGNEEIKIEIERDKILMAIPTIGVIFVLEGKLVIPPKMLQNQEHLVLVTDRGVHVVIGVKHEVLSNRASIRRPVMLIEPLSSFSSKAIS